MKRLPLPFQAILYQLSSDSLSILPHHPLFVNTLLSLSTLFVAFYGFISSFPSLFGLFACLFLLDFALTKHYIFMREIFVGGFILF